MKLGLELPQNDPTSLTKKNKLKKRWITWLLTGWSPCEQQKKTQHKKNPKNQKQTRQKESCQAFDIFILANICFFHLVAQALICENVTCMPNDESVLKSLRFSPFRWASPALPLNRECSKSPLWRSLTPAVPWSTCRPMGEVQLGKSSCLRHPCPLALRCSVPWPSAGVQVVSVKPDLKMEHKPQVQARRNGKDTWAVPELSW